MLVEVLLQLEVSIYFIPYIIHRTWQSIIKTKSGRSIFKSEAKMSHSSKFKTSIDIMTARYMSSEYLAMKLTIKDCIQGDMVSSTNQSFNNTRVNKYLTAQWLTNCGQP